MINSADKHNQNNSSLEDRHFLSDPRPVPDLDLPTWEVDVHREGVENPILTLRVDAKVLPPRRKKKKTLWKLPESIDTLPKFGEQDKRRIFEIFREKKKELKKLKNKQRAFRRASSIEAMSSGGGVANGGGSTINVPPNGTANGTASRTDPPRNGVSSIPTNLPTENGRQQSPNGVKTTGGKDNRDDDSSLSPPGFHKLAISDAGVSPSPPPGIVSPSSTLKPAPPGLPAKIQQNSPNGFSSSPSNASSSPPPNTVPPSKLPQSNGNHQPPLHTSSRSPTAQPPPGLVNGHHPPQHETSSPPRAIGPCFVLPPDSPSNASMGEFVTETYYLLLRNGMIRDLDAYYFQSSSLPENGGGNAGDRVHKALTVGGAHAVCTSQQDRLIQLNTFAGCEMRIKGVQQQPTVGNGLLVLVTGVSIRTTTVPNGQAPQHQTLPFCQTLILTPVATTTAAGLEATAASAATTNTIGYQILNDNLVILTGDE